MHRILVVGAGVGGLAAAHRLRQRLEPEDEIVVLDQRNAHTFWPSLLWILSGTRHSDDVSRPLAALRERRLKVVQAEVSAVDPTSVCVTADGRAWTGDALVLAPGAELDPSGIPGLEEGGHNLYTVAGSESAFRVLESLTHGQVVVLIASVPFKCPAAPYEAAMLVDGYLRRRRRRSAVTVSVWAAEAAPMGVAGPAISQAVVEAVAQRGIDYHPDERVEHVDPGRRRIRFQSGTEVEYDLLIYVPPHRVPQLAVQSGMAPADGWVQVDRRTLETRWDRVWAIGDVTGITLPSGKLLPKAGVFAHRQGEVVADRIAAALAGQSEGPTFDGQGECFIEMGGGVAGFARGNFYAEPMPVVRAFRPGRHWHLAKLAFERSWWSQWW
ncbi:MAG: FAD-dependent oxidoreductase [Firmicutes bacterium]|nr:FAD-dependent oxidoreductase [Bacillota bacterium]